MNISEKIFSLRKKLHDHNYRYYVLDDPLISDYDFDMMLKELEHLENENPEYLIVHLITYVPLFLLLFFNYKTKIILRISGYPKLNNFRKF